MKKNIRYSVTNWNKEDPQAVMVIEVRDFSPVYVRGYEMGIEGGVTKSVMQFWCTPAEAAKWNWEEVAA